MHLTSKQFPGETKLKIRENSLSALIVSVVLIAVTLGCNQSAETSTNSTTTTAPANSTSTPNVPSADDIAGTYDITGTNENGAGAYKGTLAVTSRGDVYQFSWDTAGKKYDGVGVRTGNHVGVAFAEGDDGQGCGVVLYKVGSDGTLDGKAGYWGNNRSETETATRIKGSGLEGEYKVKGSNTEGKPYEGDLKVGKKGAGYTFSWRAGSSFEGFGVQQADTVSVGFGGDKCGFVSYELKPGGTLDGKWGGYGSTAVGTETAKKR